LEGRVSKIDQLQCIIIAVDRFFKLSSSFDRVFKRAFLPDRLLIEGIEHSENYHNRARLLSLSLKKMYLHFTFKIPRNILSAPQPFFLFATVLLTEDIGVFVFSRKSGERTQKFIALTRAMPIVLSMNLRRGFWPLIFTVCPLFGNMFI